MNISLTPELREFVAKKVESGLYKSASEVVRERLRERLVEACFSTSSGVISSEN